MPQLSKTNLSISPQGLGCMSMSEFYGKPISQQEINHLIKIAFNESINFFDTADVYGYGKNEIALGIAIDALIKQGAKRSQFVIASKCGIVRDEHDAAKRGTNNSYDYIKTCCEQSLARLGKAIGFIDLYYLHRITPGGGQIDEAMRAMAELLEAGKIKAVGLSETSAAIIQEANTLLLKYTNGSHQLAAIQSEYSLLSRAVEKNGVLNACKELNLCFVAYSPLSRALLTGDFNDIESLEQDDFRRLLPRFHNENLAHNKNIVAQLNQLAEKKSCTTAQIALAWLMHQPHVVPIPGTTKEAHLLANIHANKVSLTPEELDLLNGLTPAKGARYPEAALKVYGMPE